MGFGGELGLLEASQSKQTMTDGRNELSDSIGCTAGCLLEGMMLGDTIPATPPADGHANDVNEGLFGDSDELVAISIGLQHFDLLRVIGESSSLHTILPTPLTPLR